MISGSTNSLSLTLLPADPSSLPFAFADTFGPEVFENFHESRLLPASNVPPSSHSVGSIGPLGADGNNILSHVS